MRDEHDQQEIARDDCTDWSRQETNRQQKRPAHLRSGGEPRECLGCGEAHVSHSLNKALARRQLSDPVPNRQRKAGDHPQQEKAEIARASGTAIRTSQKRHVELTFEQYAFPTERIAADFGRPPKKLTLWLNSRPRGSVAILSSP